MTTQASEFDGPDDYRLVDRLDLSGDQPAAVLVGRGTFNVLQWIELLHGGHLAALEQPALPAGDIPAVLQTTAQLTGVAMTQLRTTAVVVEYSMGSRN